MHNDLTIQNELKELNSILAGIPNTNVYSVPDGYFEAMVQDIMHTIEEKPVMNANTDVPAGYFDGLASFIMSRIKTESALEEDSSLLQPLKKHNTYTVPQGYFDGLAGSIISKINERYAEDERSELLDAVRNINPYSVPPGYFDSLAATITSKLPQPAKVIVMQKRSSFFKYAAAAVITGILGLSVISIVDKRQAEEIGPSSTTLMADAKKIIDNNSFDKELSAISDDDIIAYLQKGGEDVNAALVASVEDDKNLPEAVDYLTDDKTLDNLLNELNINDHSSTN